MLYLNAGENETRRTSAQGNEDDSYKGTPRLKRHRISLSVSHPDHVYNCKKHNLTPDLYPTFMKVPEHVTVLFLVLLDYSIQNGSGMQNELSENVDKDGWKGQMTFHFLFFLCTARP